MASKYAPGTTKIDCHSCGAVVDAKTKNGNVVLPSGWINAAKKIDRHFRSVRLCPKCQGK